MKNTTYKLGALSLLVTGALALSACAGGASGGGDDAAISLSVQPGSGVTTLVEIAEKQGFFADHGLKVSTVTVQNGPAAATALMSGEIQVATNAPQVFTPLVDKGADLRIIAGQTKNVTAVVAGPDHKDLASFPEGVAAMKGHITGVTAMSSATQYQMESVLDAAGLKSEDVTFVAYGSNGAQSLLAGKVDVAMLNGPGINQSIAQGSHLVVDLRKPETCPEQLSICGIDTAGMWAKGDWVDANKDKVKAVQDAIHEAYEYVMAPENEKAMKAFFATQVGDDAAAEVKEQYAADQFALLSDTFTPESLEAWRDFDVEYGIVTKPYDVDKILATE